MTPNIINNDRKRNKKYTAAMWNENEIECMCKALNNMQPRTIKQEINMLWKILPENGRMEFMKDTIPKMENLIIVRGLKEEVNNLRKELDDLKIRHRNLVATVKGRNKGREVDY